MPQRNGQNPTRAAKNIDHFANSSGHGSGSQQKSSGAGICQACGAEIPPKPGFRLSSLKCPKCGAPAGKK